MFAPLWVDLLYLSKIGPCDHMLQGDVHLNTFSYIAKVQSKLGKQQHDIYIYISYIYICMPLNTNNHMLAASTY